MELSTDTRMDKWLWSVRLYKTRKLALEACRKGRVKIDEKTVRPSRKVRLNEVILIKRENGKRTVRVIASSNRRIGPKLVSEFYEDLTDPEEFKQDDHTVAQRILARERGSGRPTKKERREIGRFLDDISL
ncbi:MAG: RNA-binding S4 domain-containing protein [Opitutaceae bacterium]|nr:RNA-binding S4 domain-containing protein [Opitutaceae bacterium]